jgi:GcrA cell cycle regulator
MNKVNARFDRKTPVNPQNNAVPFWTAERIGVLTAQWALGTSVRDIARLLGSTRNTVIGKAHRMELPMHVGSVFHPDAPRKRAEKKPRQETKQVKPRGHARIVRVRRVGAHSAPASPPSPPLLPLPPGNVPVPLRLPFAALEARHCRYSVSPQSPHFFCGHERKDKSAFCAFHHALCYEPLRGRPTELPRRARNYARAA